MFTVVNKDNIELNLVTQNSCNRNCKRGPCAVVTHPNNSRMRPTQGCLRNTSVFYILDNIFSSFAIQRFAECPRNRTISQSAILSYSRTCTILDVTCTAGAPKELFKMRDECCPQHDREIFLLMDRNLIKRCFSSFFFCLFHFLIFIVIISSPTDLT